MPRAPGSHLFRLPPLPATCTYARACQRQVSAEKLRPVKTSPMNGRNPEMKKELVTRLHKSFEDAVHHQEGTEYWLWRELQELLGYTRADARRGGTEGGRTCRTTLRTYTIEKKSKTSME